MKINLDEAKKILLYIINNNKRLQDSGQFPVSVSLCGGAGLGKTSMIDNLAKELDYNYVKLNLSQISDPSDLVEHCVNVPTASIFILFPGQLQLAEYT